MKRKLLLFLMCAVLLLTGCTASMPAMYLSPSQTQPQLRTSFQQVYDFRMDENVTSVVMEFWQLQDGQWTDLGGGKIAADECKGQFTLGFDYLPTGVTYSLSGSSFTYTINKDFNAQFDPVEGSVMYTTLLSAQQEIVYGTPIPMAIQVFTPNQETQFIGVDFFHQPEKLSAEGHHDVYAVTLTFSEDPLE